MRSDATTAEDYLAELPEDRRAIVAAVRNTINAHLPDGYTETMEWGMVTWVVPLGDYPDTYNGKPLSFVSLASQKKHVAVYLMALHPDSPDEAWLRQQYADRGMRIDLGKSCLRFTSLDEVPLDVLGEAVARVPVGELVARHEASRRR